jgi:CubicO group peptidase (beta-lactamase class C family)
MMLRKAILAGIGLLVVGSAPIFALADPGPCADVEPAVRDVLASTGVPSASVAVVRGGRVACVVASGDARLEPKAPASPAMRYSIGSVSKQFTAAAILMLAEEGKLSLDDPVARFRSDLTDAKKVKIRELLSHTSGYQDYWPQDYVPPFMKQPTTADRILDRWAKQPLDFPPGSQYQYSNTAYVIAGLIVEKASGMPLMELLEKRIFRPLGMTSVLDIDRSRLTESDPTGYQRFGLGPLRPAPKEGPGWLFAAGELAMTAEDLAKWNISVMDQKLMKPASYAEMERAVLLSNGAASAYGLGVSVAIVNGHRAIGHGGEVSGFTAMNVIYPDDRAAVTVLVNQDAIDASGTIATRIASRLFVGDDVQIREARARQILEGLQRGQIDRSIFTDDANSYFTAEALKDFASGLAPLGPPVEVKQTRQSDRGGMTFRLFEAKFEKRTLAIWERDMPDGKIEQYQVMVGE